MRSVLALSVTPPSVSQVGMAQRMESVAPPGGQTLSAATAPLVDDFTALGEPELVQIKGADDRVVARRLLGIWQSSGAVMGVRKSNLVGRRREMAAVEGLVDRALDGHGAVVGVVGSPGIGKSRWCARSPRPRPYAGSKCSAPFASPMPPMFRSRSWRGYCGPSGWVAWTARTPANGFGLRGLPMPTRGFAAVR